MRFVLLAAGLAFGTSALSARGVRAQPPAPITESEFLAAALADSATVQSLGDIGAEEEALRRSAGLLSNPTIDVEREAPGDAKQTTATLAWRPPLDGRRGLEIAAADAAFEAANRRRELAELELRIELRRVFADWSVMEERTRLVERELSRLDELARHAEARARTGEESGLNARRFRFAALELAAEHARVRAESEIARAVALSYSSEAVARPPLVPDLPEAAAPDSAESPALAALRADRARAEFEGRRARRFLAFPEIVAGWQWQEVPAADADGPVLGLAWELPLFDRGQSESGRASRTAVASRAREEALARRLEAERTSRSAAYDTLRQAAIAARVVAEPADATIEAAAAAYGYGETSMTDFLDTVRSILAGRLAALDLHAAALAAHRELERAAGRPLPR